MRVEPLTAVACALVGTVTGIGAAAWWFLGVPRRTECR